MGTGRPAIRVLAILAAAVTLVATLSACSRLEDAMTPDEARDTLVATVRDTAALIDGPAWAESYASLPQECAAGGAPGTKYGYTYSAPRPDRDRQADVEKVAEYWESLGMDVRILPERPVVFGAGGPVQNIEFSTDPGNYSIGGTSLCGLGDPDEGEGAE